MLKAKIGALAATAVAAIGFVWIPAIAQEATAPVVAAAPELRYSNKWRLEVSEGANNDGVMHFRITPQGGTPIDIPVRLKEGRGEDGCSRDIKAAFKAALDRKIYKVEGDDEEASRRLIGQDSLGLRDRTRRIHGQGNARQSRPRVVLVEETRTVCAVRAQPYRFIEIPL